MTPGARRILEVVLELARDERRGTPWNRKRAIWWINYDLLCETGKVLPCFVMKLRRLQETYQARNQVMGGPAGKWFCRPQSDGFADVEAAMAEHGPMPPLGLRAALWIGVIVG